MSFVSVKFDEKYTRFDIGQAQREEYHILSDEVPNPGHTVSPRAMILFRARPHTILNWNYSLSSPVQSCPAPTCHIYSSHSVPQGMHRSIFPPRHGNKCALKLGPKAHNVLSMQISRAGTESSVNVHVPQHVVQSLAMKTVRYLFSSDSTWNMSLPLGTLVHACTISHKKTANGK